MRRPSSLERGLTFVTVLMLLALFGATYWCFAFGPVYWQNHEVKAQLREAAASAYHDPSDVTIRKKLMRTFDDNYGYDGTDAAGHTARLNKLEFDENDLQFQRIANPPSIRVDFHYLRTVNLPIFGGQRRVAFTDHIDQDLSAVKW